MARKRGHPPHEPSQDQRDLVRNLTIAGVSQDRIAAMIGISDVTLRLHYRAELDDGSDKANAAVVGHLFNKCQNGDTAALIFWAKTRLGWKETSRSEHTGADGAPIVHRVELVGVKPNHGDDPA